MDWNSLCNPNIAPLQLLSGFKEKNHTVPNAINLVFYFEPFLYLGSSQQLLIVVYFDQLKEKEKRVN